MRRSSSRPAFSPSVSALPRPASAKLGCSSDDRFSAPSVFPVYHPVPASCSVRLTFVSFMVRISVSFCVQFSSFSAHSCSLRFPVRFSSFSACSVQLVRFPFRSVQFQFGSACLFRFVQFVFSSVSACFVFAFVCTSVFIYISRVYYTRIKANFKCIFCQKTCPF